MISNTWLVLEGEKSIETWRRHWASINHDANQRDEHKRQSWASLDEDEDDTTADQQGKL